MCWNFKCRKLVTQIYFDSVIRITLDLFSVKLVKYTFRERVYKALALITVIITTFRQIPGIVLSAVFKMY